MSDNGGNWVPRSDVYAIEIVLTLDGQSVRRRYEAPTADEVIALAQRAGEKMECVEPIVVETK